MTPQNIEYGFFLILGLTLISAVRCVVLQHKCYKYLREKHTEKWKELTTILGFGPGSVNSLRGMKFLFSKEYLGDPELLRRKVIFRNSLIHTITGIVAVFIMFCIMAYAYTKP